MFVLVTLKASRRHWVSLHIVTFPCSFANFSPEMSGSVKPRPSLPVFPTIKLSFIPIFQLYFLTVSFPSLSHRHFPNACICPSLLQSLSVSIHLSNTLSIHCTSCQSFFSLSIHLSIPLLSIHLSFLEAF